MKNELQNLILFQRLLEAHAKMMIEKPPDDNSLQADLNSERAKIKAAYQK